MIFVIHANVYDKNDKCFKGQAIYIYIKLDESGMTATMGTSLVRDPVRIETLNEFQPQLSSLKSQCVHERSHIVEYETQYAYI